ncbi:Mu transposase C-terminal domain-containing protein [Seohaeicola sp. SP36]|uniref:Mu transposase C-terminal domain-containing protein n=1 Tax=unclassified Seohaeicola TaxID=2641111 RepID=UPI00237C146E|nr:MULTISPECIES: Mu transposase C-terminal domain-containing protein [unclassified Seohaeicola]MDD9708426.1 Mu transposase C-terminal domain-containing protein [Seohaeicola sp. 4SK31]MDD9736420.1 Mu transposase C-terminal domain-containing protein [Seohaeicola sp. SP36]
MLDIQPSPLLPRFVFGQYDKIIINGISYRCTTLSEDGFVFVRTDNTGVAETFTNAEISLLVTSGRLEHQRDAFLSESAKRRLRMPTQQLSTLSPKQQQKAKYRESLVLAFRQMEAEGKVKRTEDSAKAALREIKYRAGEIYSIPSDADVVAAGANTIVVPAKVCASRLLKLVAAYDRDGISALYGRDGAQGNRSRRISADAHALLAKTVRNFLSMERPSIAQITVDVRDAFYEENIRRRAIGLSALIEPSRETIRREINSLDPFEVDIARYGLEEARKRNAPVGKGLDLTRPLERVEMDEWKVDLMTLLTGSGIWSILSEEEKASLGLEDGKKKRWFLTVAICATTRCILAMKLSRTPTKRSAMQTIDMIVRDKGVWADAVGSLSPWNMSGTPELIVTDCGSAFIDFDTRVGATDLGINIENGPGGLPELRGRIERMFGTMASKFISRFTGRTFSNTVVKGDYDPKARAALSTEDLSEALIRWVVDVYHNSPHADLQGETPAKCWKRLVALYGVSPMPSVELRRKALGTRLNRTVTKKGITVLGIHYHSDVLARWFMHTRSKDVRVRWYSEDIGSIAVELNGQWIDVPSVFESFSGERAQTWLMAVREIRASVVSQTNIDEEVVFKAMQRIREINANAMARQGLLVEDYSKERIASLEDSLLIGFNIKATLCGGSNRPRNDGFGTDLPLDGSCEVQDDCAAIAPDHIGLDEPFEPSNYRASGQAPAIDEGIWSIGEK